MSVKDSHPYPTQSLIQTVLLEGKTYVAEQKHLSPTRNRHAYLVVYQYLSEGLLGRWGVDVLKRKRSSIRENYLRRCSSQR